MSRENYTLTVSGFRRLSDSLDANADDIRFLEEQRLLLREMTEKAQTLVGRRNALEAEKQEVTRELQGLLEEGRKLASYLRAGVKQRYGTRSEKLVEFGVRPFRGRAPRSSDDEPSS